MTKVLEDAIEKVRKLPGDRQAYAAETEGDGSGMARALTLVAAGGVYPSMSTVRPTRLWWRTF
jgi:hypothetical protein